ncbi:MAG TPA: hypothetical protein VG826_34905 [Pirellulales bacterium]|nr:hypothetical protein [Pirellulales bacterium]
MDLSDARAIVERGFREMAAAGDGKYDTEGTLSGEEDLRLILRPGRDTTLWLCAEMEETLLLFDCLRECPDRLREVWDAPIGSAMLDTEAEEDDLWIVGVKIPLAIDEVNARSLSRATLEVLISSDRLFVAAVPLGVDETDAEVALEEVESLSPWAEGTPPGRAA